MDELFEAYHSGEPEVSVEEWNKNRQPEKKPNKTDKVKRSKKADTPSKRTPQLKPAGQSQRQYEFSTSCKNI